MCASKDARFERRYAERACNLVAIPCGYSVRRHQLACEEAVFAWIRRNPPSAAVSQKHDRSKSPPCRDGEQAGCLNARHDDTRTNVTTPETISAACSQAKTYYKLSGDLFAYFAATSGVGKNYTIISNGVAMFPKY